MEMSRFPQIMGILNVTPDSFSDGGKYFDKEKAIDKAFELIEDGADIIDVGGESTRPGASLVSPEEEYNRVIPVIEAIKKKSSQTKVSIDTTKYIVAQEALNLGAEIINDVSGLRFEPKFLELANNHKASIIIMHMQGEPRNMQKDPHYDDVINEVYTFLDKQSKKAKDAGINDIYVDVGIGFGKSLNHNLQLLRNLEKFNSITGKQILGISRKSFIKMLLSIDSPTDRDLPTMLIHSLLLEKNVNIIRVHDVKSANHLKKLHNQLFN